MGQWVVAYCTRPLGERFYERVEHGLDAGDFASMAEWQSLDEEAGYLAEDSLRVERLPGDRRVVHVHYRHHQDGDRWLHCEHHLDPAFVKEDIESQLEEEPPAAARQLLPRVVETVAFELKVTDMAGMGLPIAYYLAMALAAPAAGDGLVEVEGEWWDPKGYRRL